MAQKFLQNIALQIHYKHDHDDKTVTPMCTKNKELHEAFCPMVQQRTKTRDIPGKESN